MRLRTLLATILLGGGSTAAVQAAAVPPEVDEAFDRGTIEVETDQGLRAFGFRMHRPESASPKTPLPLVVFLHGAGERGDDNARQLGHFPDRWVSEPHLAKRHDAIVLAVQCPENETWSPTRRNEQGEWSADAAAPMTDSMRAVIAKIRELAQDPSIDRSRIYLTGLSMGGFGSWDLARRHPDWFAAVVPICGGSDAVFGPAFAASEIPIWNVHGAADQVVSVDLSRAIVKSIRDAGGRIGYTELPGVGHGSWNMAYGPGGCMTWMFAQQRPTPAEISAP
jgi:predicted peptidase